MFTDGCTALSWKKSSSSFLAQNWDWQQEQQENLILLRIRQSKKPAIEMVTEAGIIGKIGLNSSGVGVCLNAIRARGVDFDRLPCHLALRACLDSWSKDKAMVALRKAGVASACHILVADLNGATGMECSHIDTIELPMSDRGIITHTNHFTRNHAGVEDKMALPDSPVRHERIDELVETIEEDSPGFENIGILLNDERDFPTSICRQQTDTSTVATLFSIVMDLGGKSAWVKIGRPISTKEILELVPGLLLPNGRE